MSMNTGLKKYLESGTKARRGKTIGHVEIMGQKIKVKDYFPAKKPHFVLDGDKLKYISISKNGQKKEIIVLENGIPNSNFTDKRRVFLIKKGLLK